MPKLESAFNLLALHVADQRESAHTRQSYPRLPDSILSLPITTTHNGIEQTDDSQVITINHQLQPDLTIINGELELNRPAPEFIDPDVAADRWSSNRTREFGRRMPEPPNEAARQPNFIPRPCSLIPTQSHILRQYQHHSSHHNAEQSVWEELFDKEEGKLIADEWVDEFTVATNEEHQKENEDTHVTTNLAAQILESVHYQIETNEKWENSEFIEYLKQMAKE